MTVMERESKTEQWSVWGEKDADGVGHRVYPPRKIEGQPPPEAEKSADGTWATLFEEGEPVRVWVRSAL